ncbi:MAG TPA: universal stress protein [Nocardioidaceae bacterium]|nr:universal stress protein [Nocardioidaceae bacterium]
MDEIMPEVTKFARPDGGVVVGDDGSEGAAHAVRYALEEARRRNMTLHVIRAWSILSTSRPADVPPGFAASLPEYEASAREEEQARVEHILGADPGVPVEVHCVHSPAATALIKASETADVVVVGSRGLGGFRSLVLGSVAEQCIRHCAGPVIVVRHTAQSA